MTQFTKQNIKTIVFDLDGTLIDTSKALLYGFNVALNPYGFNVTPQDLEDMRSHSARQLFRDKLPEKEAREAVNLLTEYSKNSSPQTILIPGIRAVLETIANGSIQLAVWTGRDRSSAIHLLKHHGIEHYFETIVSSCDVESNKPNAEGLIRISNTLNVNPEHMIHIGDHEHDLIGANSANVFGIHARWTHDQLSTQWHPLSKHTVDAPIDLQHWLEFIMPTQKA